MRDLAIGETGGLGFPLCNGRQIARTSDGRWLAITDDEQRVTGKASVAIRAAKVAQPLDEGDFEGPVELAGNLGSAVLGDRSGPADQGCIVVDSRDVLHAIWRRAARNGAGELWYAQCALTDKELVRQLGDATQWRGPSAAGVGPTRLDEVGQGPASLGDMAVAADGSASLTARAISMSVG